MISNKKCYYCGNVLHGSRRHFCSDVCNAKYWSGVYSKKWKEGDFANGKKPTMEDVNKSKKRYNARKLAYKKYKLGVEIRCDLCKKKTKNAQRHHEDYDKPEVFMVVCTKCHGFIKRYNSLRRMLNLIQSEGGKTK